MTAPLPPVNMIVDPGSAVPVTVGVLSVIVLPSSGDAIVGAAGAVASMVIDVLVGVEALPAGSVAVTTRGVDPSGNGLASVIVQFPLASTTAVPMGFPRPSVMVMVSPGVPDPMTSGVVSDVRYGSLVSPPMLVSAGAAGAVVSRVNVVLVGLDVFPAGSVAVALIVVLPSASADDGVYVQFPLESAIVVPMMVPLPSVKLIVDPGSAVPVMVGVLSMSVLPETGAVIDGDVGAVVSTVKVVATEPVVLPAPSVSETLTVFAPSERGVGIVKA